MRKRNVTFMEDLRENGWQYAAAVLGVTLYSVLKALGADLWIAILLTALVAAGLGFVVKHRR